ncbi:MAG: polysaccharide biosynthesis/export family protein [Bacteroidales bacterium]|jgi:polysaccharide export outer membrane protein|nr:polysaccharide biosynthesis/export family protein [Bacteroidales bacterium]
MKPIKLFTALACVAVLACSCISSKEVSYLQNLKHNQTVPLNGNFEAVISPYDQLRITVIGVGDEKELAEPFNPFGTTQSSNSNASVGYLVDVHGNIQFPTLGMIHVKGMTRIQLQDLIKTKLVAGGYMNDPMVDVRFMNFRVFVLGTSDGGKVLNINNERCTFLEALAMAGGLNQYTKRDKIAVMREVDGKIITHFLDPRSTDVFYDEFFLLQQNDVIVTQSFRRAYAQDAFGTGLNIVGTIASVLSSVAMIYLMVSGRF